MLLDIPDETQAVLKDCTVEDLNPILLRLKKVPLKEREKVFMGISRVFDRRKSDLVRAFELLCK